MEISTTFKTHFIIYVWSRIYRCLSICCSSDTSFCQL